MMCKPEIGRSWVILAFRKHKKKIPISKQHEMETSPLHLAWMMVVESCVMMGLLIRGRLSCYLGVYPISRIKHRYWLLHFLLDRVPLTCDGWRRSARRARVKRGRFVKITIANCNPLHLGLFSVNDDDYLNLNLVWDVFLALRKQKKSCSWVIFIK